MAAVIPQPNMASGIVNPGDVFTNGSWTIEGMTRYFQFQFSRSNSSTPTCGTFRSCDEHRGFRASNVGFLKRWILLGLLPCPKYSQYYCKNYWITSPYHRQNASVRIRPISFSVGCQHTWLYGHLWSAVEYNGANTPLINQAFNCANRWRKVSYVYELYSYSMLILQYRQRNLRTIQSH